MPKDFELNEDRQIKDDLEKEGKKLELLVLLFANVATISFIFILKPRPSGFSETGFKKSIFFF